LPFTALHQHRQSHNETGDKFLRIENNTSQTFNNLLKGSIDVVTIESTRFNEGDVIFLCVNRSHISGDLPEVLQVSFIPHKHDDHLLLSVIS
jgi:hypothetical protein